MESRKIHVPNHQPVNIIQVKSNTGSAPFFVA